MIGKEQSDGNMPGKWPEAQRAVGDIAACMQASVWGANPICFSFTLFVWSNLWIMKNKRHQCAEVQLICLYFAPVLCALVHMQFILPTLFQIPKLYFIEFWCNCETPSLLLTCDPSLLFHVRTTVPYVFGPHCNPPAESRPKCSQGIFLMRPSYAQQLDGPRWMEPSTKSVRKDLDHVVNKIPWTKDGIIIIPSWKYATTTTLLLNFSSTYLLSKLISKKESFNLFYEMLLIPPRCYRFTPKI